MLHPNPPSPTSVLDDTSRRLVTLTPLSPLSGKGSLKYTPALDDLALGLSQFGFEMGYAAGSQLQVTPVSSTSRPQDAPGKMTIDTFMGGLTRERTSFLHKPRLASTLVFSKSGQASTKKTASGPATPLKQATPPRCSTPQPSSISGPRFSRLAQSVDSLQQLQVPGGAQVNPVNLLALGSPRRPSTVPCKSSAITAGLVGPALDTSVSSQPPSRADITAVSQAQAVQSQDGISTDRASSAARADARATQRPATPCVDVGKAATAALRPTTPAPGSEVRPRTCLNVRGPRPHPMANFKATRGHALVVFQHMDRDKNGQITLSELEDAALGIGFTLQQAHKLFQILDKSGKGYLLANDWGSLEMKAVIELFSLAYMQRFMGLPGPTSIPGQVDQYWATQNLKAVRTVGAAIHMARSNALARASRSANSSGDIIFDVFNFIDTDGSGRLSYDELRDGFFALGVYVKDDVLEKMMESCDTNHDGHINYFEFINSFFPKQWK